MKLNQAEVVEYIKTNLKEFGGQMTQTDIAKQYQVSSPRISQMVKKLRPVSQEVASEVAGEAAAS